MQEEGVAGAVEEAEEATTHAINSNRATAPEAATVVSPMRAVEVVVVPLLAVTINQVRAESELYESDMKSSFNDEVMS